MKMEFTGSRRTFIKKCGDLRRVLPLAWPWKPPAAATPSKPLEQKTESSQGYRLTEHVKKYYETARL